MRIAVLGLEDFGFHLACTLHELGDEVMAVDRDENRVQEIMRYVSKAIVADVADREALKDLGHPQHGRGGGRCGRALRDQRVAHPLSAGTGYSPGVWSKPPTRIRPKS
jgi:hypothetical protein